MTALRCGVLALLWLLPALAHARLDTAQPRRLDNGAHLDWVPCWFEPSFAGEVRCAHFVPSPVAAGDIAVRLPVVVLKSSMLETRPSPVLYLPPGPGSAVGLTRRGMEVWWHWQGLARWPHDVVLFDVRGAGESRPRLDCPEIAESDRAGLARPLTAEQDLRALQLAAHRCHRRLRTSGIDPAQFSTERQVRDAGELLALLGGSDWNLWGVSYGTRLALHVAREFPARIRSLTLDSVYPPEVNGLLAKPEQFDRIVETLAGICARDATCAADHPALDRRMRELMARLAARPAPLTVEKWPGVWRHRLEVNDYRFLWMLFLESYRSPWHPRYPRAVTAALAGNYEPLQPLAETFIDTLLDPNASHGLYYSTVCPEDLAGVGRAAYVAEAQRHPAVADYVLPEWDLHVCHVWDAGRLPARYREPVRSDIPALLITVTLPGWAARAATGLRNGRLYTLAHSSHAVTWENDCALGLVWEFLADPGAPAEPACWRELEAAARGP